jgi:riboflavin kinase/FMN adenylyltransferase
MQIISDLQSYKARPARPVVLALGNFDGFHLGHQKLLRYVVRQAKKERALAAVLTFPEHPHSILHPKQKPMMLMSIEQKLFYLARAGIDLCFLQSFTPSFAGMTPRDFVERILVKKLHIREICMGYDAHFGRGRKGDTDLMARLARSNGFLFKRMKPVMVGKKPVSSSRVRELLARGKVEQAQACLGRPFSMFGKVIHGKGHGLHLGFPTANLEVHSEILLPLGVYVASARFLSAGPRAKGRESRHNLGMKHGPLIADRVPGDWLQGVMNFGKRPTYPKAETPRPVLELHLLDFKGQIYGEMMEIALHRFLRSEAKFPTEDALKTQIRKDIRVATRFYGSKRV